MIDKYTAEQIDACIVAYRAGDLNYCRAGIIDLLTNYAQMMREREAIGLVKDFPRYLEWRHLREHGAWSNGVPAWAKDRDGRMNDYIAACAVIDELAARHAAVPDGFVLVPSEASDVDAFMVYDTYKQFARTRKDAYRIAIAKLAERAKVMLSAAPEVTNGLVSRNPAPDASYPMQPTSPTVRLCVNCDSPLPEGCKGCFKDEPQCEGHYESPEVTK